MKEEDIDDPRFVERLRRADREALEKVVRWYLPQILRAGRAAGLPADEAEEAVQAVFVTFFEKIHEFEGRSRVRTWLFGILYKKVMEARRGLKRNWQYENIEEADHDRFKPDGTWVRPPLPADIQVYSREVGRYISDCLEEVPEKQRMAFVLREKEWLETGEVCQILDVTETNLGVLLYRVRSRLRDCLEAKGLGR